MKHETISRRESADDYYRIIARLNPRWRVIACPDGIQWILQYRSSGSGSAGTAPGAPETYARARWENRVYARTKTALTRRSTLKSVGDVDPAAARILADLPDWLDEALRGRPIPRLRYGRHTRLA
jgi:hypothetical protein